MGEHRRLGIGGAHHDRSCSCAVLDAESADRSAPDISAMWQLQLRMSPISSFIFPGLISPQQIPVSLTLSQPTTGSASLSWAANAASDLVGYKVYIGTQSGRHDSPITLGTITAYTATNLALGRTCYFRISAFNSASNESLCSAR